MDRVRARLTNSPAIRFVEYTPFDHQKAWSIVAANYFEDSGADIRRTCSESTEPLDTLTEWILEQCEINARLVGGTLQQRKAARDSFRTAYLAHWSKFEIDVLVMPAAPGTAPFLGTSKYWGYTAVWNLLSYPVIALPAAALVGEKNSLQDLLNEQYTPRNDIELELHRNYSASASEDMPVGIQVVAPRLHESMVVAASYVIENALQGSEEVAPRL